MMTPEIRQQVRIGLLRYLEAAKPRALSGSLLHSFLRAEGMPVEPEGLRAELAYLADKGMAARSSSPMSPELAGWRITAAGRDWLAEEGITP
ncbi:MAG: hypothetical protein KF833_18585 [Verrucomicrobiae bacterium]|nr:hypothetical protein [Verrucomicrobiae bacterium]